MTGKISREKGMAFIAGNWKMNKTLVQAKELATEVVRASTELLGTEIVLCPPFTVLTEVAKITDGTSVGLGGQDVFWENWGAFTGEISAPMLRDAGCQYVIVGHSERRQIMGETDSMVNRKVKAALKNELIPIVCVGETLEERDKGLTLDRVKRQVFQALEGIETNLLEKVVVAYEPVWAIGTGRNANPEQAQEVHSFLREILGQKFGNKLAACAIILYGGSVKPDNARALMSQPDVDGFLVGGASLEATSFIKIIQEALESRKE